MDVKRLKKTLLFSAAVIMAVIIFAPGYLKLTALKAENKKLKQEIYGLKQGNGNLKQEIILLEEDKEYIEKTAREKLGLTKEG
ncbi:MAG: septum formation initiator family protein, partial [Candidatus Omnitrophica bacterium]|nr:septum formation initiator family protein [Candidatus Omnitrophota bacterium]